MIAKVNHPEREHLRFLRHLGCETRLAERHAHFAGIAGVIIEPLDSVGEDIGALAIGSEERADGVVRAHFLEIDDRTAAHSV